MSKTKQRQGRKLLLLSLVMALVLPLLAPAVAARAASATKKITTNKAYVDKLTSEAAVKYYQFTVDQSGYFVISLKKRNLTDDANSGWNLLIQDLDGNTLRDWGGIKTSFQTPRLNFKKGTKLLVKIEETDTWYSRSSLDVDYSLKVITVANAQWEQENNDSFKTANVIKSGKTGKIGTVWNTGDVDYYVYTVDKSGFIKLKMEKQVKSDDSCRGWNVVLIDKSGNELRDFSGITTSFTTPNLNFKKGTKLYIKIVPTDTWASRCPVDIKYHVSIISSANAKWEQETLAASETTKNATVTKAGTTKIGTLMWYEDVDYYKFVPVKNGKLNVTLQKLNGSDDAKSGWNVEILNANGKVLGGKYGVTTKDITKGITVKKGKVYYFKVTCRDNFYSRNPRDVVYLLKTTLK